MIFTSVVSGKKICKENRRQVGISVHSYIRSDFYLLCKASCMVTRIKLNVFRVNLLLLSEYMVFFGKLYANSSLGNVSVLIVCLRSCVQLACIGHKCSSPTTFGRSIQLWLRILILKDTNHFTRCHPWGRDNNPNWSGTTSLPTSTPSR